MITATFSEDRALAPTKTGSPRGVRQWLFFLILLSFAMVLVGGATRLSESGLSITEWNVVTGTVPPLTQEAWQAEFDLYRQSPQYDLLNKGMSLDAFRTIYWWEWAHRELGRVIGLVYLAGFFWFVGRRAVPLRPALALAGVGVLLGLQGAVGWIMVASGLEPGMTSVAPVKLTLHLTLAALFFSGLVVLYIRLGGAASESATRGQRAAAWVLLALAFMQVALGGLVAGHDAGLTYNTWPLMDGRVVPTGLSQLEPFWLNAVGNVTAIQFNHRLGGYVLAAAILAYAVTMRRGTRPMLGRALLISLVVLAQVAVGVMTLVQVVPTGLALIHQGMALILVLALTWNASVLRSG